MAVTTDPAAIAKAIQQLLFAKKMAQNINAMRNTGNVQNNQNGNVGSTPVGSTLAGLPQGPVLEDLKMKGLIREGMPAEQALAIINLANIRGGVPLDIKTLTDQINADYSNYTGDILTAGGDWMKELYGNVTPGADATATDPNAALFAQDPIFSSYAGGMGQLQETSDLNRTNDLAWFQKQQATEQDFIDNLMMYTSQGGLNQDTGGGSGGGGYGGGGGGGSSDGGNGDLGYGDIKTTERLRELFRNVTENKFEAENPNFQTDLMQWAGQDIPEDAGYLQNIGYENQTPEELQAALPGEIAALYAKWLGGITTNASNAQWTGTQPEAVDERMRQFMAQNNITLGDNPKTEGVVEPYYYSENLNNQVDADGNPIANPLYGTDVDFSYGMPAPGVNSVGQQTPGQTAAWQRNVALFQQLLDPANLTQNINPTGLQGEELRNKIASIAGGVRDIARQRAAGGGFNAAAHAAASNPWSALGGIMTTHTNDPNTSIPAPVAGNAIPTGMTTNTPPPPEDINSYAVDPSTGMTWNPLEGVWVDASGSANEAVQASAAGISPAAVQPGTPVNTGTAGLFTTSAGLPDNAALVANLDEVMASGDVDRFLQYVYPGLTPNQRSLVDLHLNSVGIDTPARTADQQKVISILAAARARLNNTQSPTLGSGYTPMDPQHRALLFNNSQNVTDLVNRAWQNMGLGGNLNMEQRPDIAGLLQEQSYPVWESTYLNSGLPAPETPPQGAVWQTGAPTAEALNSLQRTAAALTAAQDFVENYNQNYNYVNTHAGGTTSTLADEQVTGQANSYDPAAAITAFGVGDFNESAPDPLPGSPLDNGADDYFSGGNTGFSTLGSGFNSNSIINRIIKGLGSTIPSAPQPTVSQPTNAQRQQVGNLASAFKQAAVKQQATDRLSKIRSLLTGVKKNFG